MVLSTASVKEIIVYVSVQTCPWILVYRQACSGSGRAWMRGIWDS